jgi:hypothetical protein
MNKASEINCKILAQAIFDIRLLLSGYLGSNAVVDADESVRLAAHMAYALHNEAFSILNGQEFDNLQAVEKIKVVDQIFSENISDKYMALSLEA